MTPATPQTWHLPVSGMTCASCVARVERALAALPGVQGATVNLATQTATLSAADPAMRASAIAAIARAGYGVPAQPLDLAVEGMTCASCVGRVERALTAVAGVTGASVNLATQTARVDGTADPDDVLQALTRVGYPGRVLTAADAPSMSGTAEGGDLRRAAILAGLLTLPVFVLEMGSHLIPALHHAVLGSIGQQGSWTVQLVLTALVLAGPGLRFFRSGLPALVRGAPDMNSLVAIGTGAAFAQSALATLTPALLPPGAVAVYFEAAALIVTLVLLGRWLEQRARGQAAAAIRGLLALQPATARRHGPNGVTEVPVSALIPGDRIDLRPGDRVPVDGIVTDGGSAVDESMITGEALPVAKHPGDPLTGGTVNGTGALTFRATAVGQDTMLARIARMVQSAQAGKLPVQAMVDRVTLWFVPVVLVLAGLTFAAWLAFGPAPALPHALTSAVAVLIIACPCAMGLATPTSILVGTGRGATLGILFRRGAALQALAGVATVAFDKTGTLTEGRPVLTDLILAPGHDRSAALTDIAAVEARSEHPLARAIGQAAAEAGLVLPPVQDFAATPGQGASGLVGGRRVLVGSAAFLVAQGVDASALAQAADALANAGKSVIFGAVGGQIAALVAVADPVKPTTPAALRTLRGMGLTLAMISGDNRRTAQAIGATLPLDRITAGVLPGAKVAALRALPGPVAFVGDGINDAPALAAAEVGIAIGTGTDIAIEAADVVLVSGRLTGVADAIALSRATMRNIRQNLFWAFAYNAALIPVAAGALYPAFGITLSPVLAAAAMALSSLFVLANALRLRRFRMPEGAGS